MKIDDKTSHNSPSLRFPEFTGEWERCVLGDVLEFSNTRINSSELNSGNYVSTENILQNFQGIVKARSIPEDTNVMAFSCGNILLSNIRPYLKKVWKATFNGGCSSDVFVLQANSNIDADYLHYVVANDKFIGFVMNGAKGVKMPRGDKNQMKTYSLSLPSIKEQRKISRFLSFLDERIAVQNRLIEDLKKFKCALEERMLGQCQGKQVRLRDILIERVEKSRINNQYEVLSSTVSGIYSQREYFNKEIASADNTGYKAIHRGDVVLSPQNLWMGNINYNDRFEIGIVSPSYKVFSIDEKFDKGYIAFLLKTRKALWAYSLVSEQGASIVRRNLNYESFLEISFVIPSLKEQQATARRLSAFKQKQTMEEAFLRSLLLQKEFMLKSLFI